MFLRIFLILFFIPNFAYCQLEKAAILENLNQSYFQFKTKQNHDSALLFATNALSKSEQINWAEGKCISYHRIGNAYNLNGQFDIAIENFLKSLVYAESIKRDSIKARLYFDLGSSYGKLNKNDLGILNHLKAYPIFQKLKMYDQAGYALNNIGLCYGRKNNDELSLKYLILAKAEFKKNNHLFGIGIAYDNIGNLKVKNGDFIEGEKLILQSIEIFKKLDNSFLLAEVSIDLARLYDKSKLKDPIQYYKKAITIAENKKLLSLEYDASLELSRVFENKRDFSAAYNFLERSNTIKFQIEKSIKEKNIANLNLNYSIEKQKLIEIENQLELQKQKNTLNALFFILILTMLSGIYIVWYNNNLKSKNRTINIQKEELEILNSEVNTMNLTLEKRVTDRTAELKKANSSLIKKNKEIEEALFIGQKNERKRIASDLHDSLGGYLSAIRFGIMNFKKEEMQDSEKIILEKVNNALNLAYLEVRNISHNLIPKNFEEIGLKSVLSNLISEINNYSVTKHINYLFENDNLIKNHFVEFEIYNICLELINNYNKHSVSKEVKLKIDVEKKTITILFHELSSTRERKAVINNGNGLQNISERVKNLKGTCQFHHYNYTITIPI